jgi:Zn-dependent protease with chaperone function
MRESRFVDAMLYDGLSSDEHEVVLEFTPTKRIKIEKFGIDVAFDEVQISSRLASTPRILKFPNKVVVKTLQNDTIDEIIEQLYNDEQMVHKIEKSWIWTMVSLVFMVVFVGFLLTYGSSFGAKFIADKLPADSLDKISQISLEQMVSSDMLKPTKLSLNQKRTIQSHFDRLINGDKKYKLHFYSAPDIGANAFALPSGDIVLTDQLVAKSKDDNFIDIMGVLAHEKGHVVKKHSLQGAIKSAILASIVGYISGDITSIAVALPTLLIENGYSREFEEEADMYAVIELSKLGVEIRPMAELFKELGKEEMNATSADKYFSTHPLTEDRVKFFNKFIN